MVSAPQLQKRWWASNGNGAWTGRSLLKATRCQVSDVRRLEDASLAYSSLHGWDERGPARGLPVADAPLLAYPRLRRLLVLHAARRGGRRPRRGARAPALRHGGARRDRARGRRAVHLARRHRRAVRRQRAGLERPPARGGAVVPRRAARRRRRPRLAAPRIRARSTICSRGGAAKRTSLSTLPPTDQECHAHQRRAHEQAQQQVVTIAPDATVRELLGLLAEHNVGAVVVSSDGAAVDGIVSERDVVRRLHDDEVGPRRRGQRDHDQRRRDLPSPTPPSTTCAW